MDVETKISSSHRERTSEVKRIREEGRRMVEEGRRMVGDTRSEVKRIREEGRRMVEEGRRMVGDTRSEVKRIREEGRRMVEEGRREVQAEVPVEDKPRVTVEEVPVEGEVSAEEAAGIEPRLLAVIRDNPQGISLPDAAVKLGVSTVVLARASKSLVDQGKVRKEDKLYFPEEEEKWDLLET